MLAVDAYTGRSSPWAGSCNAATAAGVLWNWGGGLYSETCKALLLVAGQVIVFMVEGPCMFSMGVLGRDVESRKPG